MVATPPAAPQALTVLFLSAANVSLAKFRALQEIARPYGIRVAQRALNSLPDGGDASTLPPADWWVIDAYQQELVQTKLGQVMQRSQQAYLWPRETAPQAQGSDRASLPTELVQHLSDAYQNGGRANYAHFFQTLQQWHTQQRLPSGGEPMVFPKVGIYYPRADGTIFTTPEDYLAWRALDRAQLPPVIAVNFHQQQIGSLQTEVVDDLVQRIEQAGAIALPYFNPAADEHAHAQMLSVQGRRVADVVINTRIMLNAEGARRAFEALGLPVVQATTYRRGSAQDWRNDPQGIPAMDLPLYVAQPEFTGISDIQITSAVDAQSGSTLPIASQTQSVVDKALRLVRLQRLANADKRISLFFWNSPPGEKNLSSAFLNVPQSMGNVLSALQAAGYTTAALPQDLLVQQLQRLLTPLYRDVPLQSLLDAGLAATLPVAVYEEWLHAQPASVRSQVDARWGVPSASDMVLDVDGQPVFVIPRLELGNVAIVAQPPRSDKKDDQAKALYHSLASVPTHFYLATYLWARAPQAGAAHDPLQGPPLLAGGWGSDAILHFGTHGSQEWLPGKERGLSVTDYPSLMVGDVPVIYPYIVDNIGEAQQAKRRGRALTLSYQTPAFQPAGLHKEWVQLHEWLHHWQAQDTGAVKDQYRTDILRAVSGARMDKDMGWNEPHTPDNFAKFVVALHDHLHELAETIQPLGLHSLGSAPEAAHRLSTVAMMLGRPYWHAAARYLGADAGGAEEAMVGSYDQLMQSAPMQVLQRALVEGVAIPDASDDSAPAAALRPWLLQARDFYDRLGAHGELPALLNALAGRYIPTSYGGDPVKNPDAFPTGRNLYGFDPARVPSAQAWAAGQKAAEQMLQTHRQRTGQGLKKVTFSLWSVETMRHQGILEAQALHLMGVKPVWDKGGRVVDVQRVERAALGRPRVDVVLSATGLYRDHFPTTLKLLAKAARLAATADEPDNPAWAFSQAVRAQLLAAGVPQETADDASQTRIFSTASGEYGTGLPEATLASDNWGGKAEGDAQLAQLYLQRMQSAYGPDEKRWGKADLSGVEGEGGRTGGAINLYAAHLKGTQAAVLARSSNTYGMLTTDDPFQYLGGIGLAVRALDGQTPALYISNLRNAGATRTEAAQDFLAKELATRQFHPGYIQGLMKEGYSGTLRVLDATNNLWGWTAVAREIVRDDQWQEMADVYVNDKHQIGVSAWMEQHNPHAYAQTMERMLEAARKGYWQASPETVAQLTERYSALQQRFDVVTSNQALMDFVRHGQAMDAVPTQAPVAVPASMPPATASAAAPVDAAQTPAAPAEPVLPTTPPIVRGLLLEKVQPPAPVPRADLWTPWVLAWLVLVVTVAGAVGQSRPLPRTLRRATSTASCSLPVSP